MSNDVTVTVLSVIDTPEKQYAFANGDDCATEIGYPVQVLVDTLPGADFGLDPAGTVYPTLAAFETAWGFDNPPVEGDDTGCVTNHDTGRYIAETNFATLYSAAGTGVTWGVPAYIGVGLLQSVIDLYVDMGYTIGEVLDLLDTAPTGSIWTGFTTASNYLSHVPNTALMYPSLGTCTIPVYNQNASGPPPDPLNPANINNFSNTSTLEHAHLEGDWVSDLSLPYVTVFPVVRLSAGAAVPDYKAYFSEFNGNEHEDWLSTGLGQPFDSYFETCATMKDASLKTNTPYIHTFMTNDPDSDSQGAFMKVKWDWIDEDDAVRTQGYDQVYKQEANGKSISIKKTRIRGKGQGVHIRYKNDGDKDFNIKSWIVLYDSNAST